MAAVVCTSFASLSGSAFDVCMLRRAYRSRKTVRRVRRVEALA